MAPLPSRPFRFLALALIAGLAPALSRAGAAAPLRVVLRYDDYSQRSDPRVDSFLVRVFDSLQVPCTYAVIPYQIAQGHDPQSRDSLALGPGKVGLIAPLVAKGLIEVALHGYTHRSLRDHDYSEFAGGDPSLQDYKIRQGKAFLESRFGVPVTTFVPPWNTYDRATLASLARAGFTCISGFPDQPAAPASPLRFLPATALMRNLPAHLARARREGDTGLILVYFHPYEFRESDPVRGRYGFTEFRSLLADLKASPDVELSTVGALARRVPWSDAATYARVSRPWRWLPHYFSRRLLPACGPYPRTYYQAWLRVIGLWGGLAAGLAALAGLAGWYAVRRKRAVRKTSWVGAYTAETIRKYH